MPEQPPQRRLAAILAADVVGYSRLMEQDETGTLAALKSRRTEIFQPLVSKHHGRIIKVMGDGVLVEFASAVEAVGCALALQEAMAAANASTEEGKRIVLRIGINLGDVMVEGGDLYGDGVNIAARLEALAEPGSICVSGKVCWEAAGKIPCEFIDIGEQKMKNIAQPVRVYRVAGAGLPVPLPATAPVTGSRRPSIAVLPFTNMSGDAEQQYLSDGITEDIITELSRYQELLVIARNSSFQFRDKAADMKRVGRELGAEYLVEGSIRKAGNRLRITAQLIDTSSGGHIWAERYDRELKDVFDIQDDVTRSIVAALALGVSRSGTQKTRRKPTELWAAYDYFLRAQEHNYLWEVDQSFPLLKKALEIDPNYARAHTLLADCYMGSYFEDGSQETLDAALAHAKKAISLDDNDAFCHQEMGFVQIYYGRFDLAEEHYRRAIALNPNSLLITAMYGYCQAMSGRPEEALKTLEAATVHDPFRWVGFFEIKSYALFFTGRYTEAVETLAKMEPKQYFDFAYLAAAYGQLGNLAGAAAAAAEVMRRKPQFSISWFDRLLRFANPADRQRLLEGLHKAGLPE
jgi:TolB-like protein/class 3 adenylate cyclase